MGLDDFNGTWMINTFSLTLHVEPVSVKSNFPLLFKHFPKAVPAVQPADLLPQVQIMVPPSVVPEQIFFVSKSLPVSLPHVSSDAPQVHFPSLTPLVWQNGSG